MEDLEDFFFFFFANPHNQSGVEGTESHRDKTSVVHSLCSWLDCKTETFPQRFYVLAKAATSYQHGRVSLSLLQPAVGDVVSIVSTHRGCCQHLVGGILSQGEALNTVVMRKMSPAAASRPRSLRK